MIHNMIVLHIDGIIMEIVDVGSYDSSMFMYIVL